MPDALTIPPALMRLATLLAGENQSLGQLESSLPGNYVATVGATSGADINLGNPGAAGNKIYALMVYNGSGQAFTACTLKDGSTVLDALTLGMTTLANGSFATWTPPGGALESRSGGWKLNITTGGSPTMSGIKIIAVVAQ